VQGGRRNTVEGGEVAGEIGALVRIADAMIFRLFHFAGVIRHRA